MASICRSCKTPIVWVKLDSGRSIPVDEDSLIVWKPQSDDAPDGHTVSGRLVLEVQGKPGMIIEVPEGRGIARVGIPHFVTCPHADMWRKSGKDAATKED